MKIALLAAETYNWNIFLRAHLDIMNDNFQRMSDGGYAQKARQTYIKEIEDLGINVVDLLIGTCLYIENASSNHYFSGTQRVGRALAESKYKDQIEDKILNMIKDDHLDDLNRIIAYFLFDNYNNYLIDKNRWSVNIKRLDTAVTCLPLYISQRIRKDNYYFENELNDQYSILNEHFNITESYSGIDIDSLNKYWSASLQDKLDTVKLFIDVKYNYNFKPQNVMPIINIKDSLFNKVRNITFIMDSLIVNNLYSVNVSYEYSESLNEADKKEFLKYLPKEMKSIKKQDLNKLLHFKLSYNNRWANYYEWLIFPDGKLLLWKYCCQTLPFLKYKEEQIRIENDGSGIQVFKFFDYNGNIIEYKK
jgi:hypothetical protein